MPYTLTHLGFKNKDSYALFKKKKIYVYIIYQKSSDKAGYLWLINHKYSRLKAVHIIKFIVLWYCLLESLSPWGVFSPGTLRPSGLGVTD